MKDTNTVLIIVSVVIGVVIIIYFLTKKKKKSRSTRSRYGDTYTGYTDRGKALICADMQYGSCPSGGQCDAGDPTCYCVYECVPPWGTVEQLYVTDCSAGSKAGFKCPDGYKPRPWFIPK